MCVPSSLHSVLFFLVVSFQYRSPLCFGWCCILLHIDNILVSGESESTHLHKRKRVLARLEAGGLRLKRTNCAFMLPSMDYLGHTITAEGLQPTKEKVHAIVEAPAPQNASQLRSSLGLVIYYNKFSPEPPAH